MRPLLLVCCLLVFAGAAFAAPADSSGQLLYFGTWPHEIVVFDSEQEKVVDKIDLKTDVPQYVALSADKKKLFVNTLNDNSIVTIDLATRKVIGSFHLNTGNRSVRLNGLTPDPSGRYLYSVGDTIVKQVDHFDVKPHKLFVVDLVEQKISRSAEFPKEESLTGFWRIEMKLSPDAKYLYLFTSSILVFDTAEFKLVKKIDLAKPGVSGVENVSLNMVDEEPAEDPNAPPGKMISLFNSSDPYVHRQIFGIAEIDLAKLTFTFTPVAPVTTSAMQPLLLTPDRKTGYTATIDGGQQGNRRCEFWAFDMQTRKVINKKEFEGRNRFSFGMSADGKKLFIYGAGYQIEVYDAKTFELRNAVDLPGDLSTNLVVMPLGLAAASASTAGVAPAAR